MTAGFRLEIHSDPRPDVFVTGPDGPPADLIQRLDERGLRAIGDLPGLEPDDERLRRIMGGCVAVAAVPPASAVVLRIAEELRLTVHPDAPVTLARRPDRIPPYAFFIGRLERDFAQARAAIRTAVEDAAGIPFLWVDDGRHRTNVPGVRERTRLLLAHATFVVADLTLGPESPAQENPSRAHEIGMSMAYSKPLVLTSQEPRRHPYYSVGDLQLTFWETEDELERVIRSWIAAERPLVARQVFNANPPPFRYDPDRRFVGPNISHRA